MVVKLEQAHLDRYLESLPESERSQAGRYARMYLEQCTDTSREQLDRFFNNIRRTYKSGSYRYIWQVIRRFFRVNNLPWPYRVSETPVVSDFDVFAPALALDVVQDMIRAAKRRLFPPREAFYLAISTTYGLRRVEMAVLRREHIDLENRLIYIHTAKHGRERYHRIPDEIFPYVAAYQRLVRPISTKSMTRAWLRIEEAVGFPHVEAVGWHSIRRTLNKYLIEEARLPETVVLDFLRWKRSSTNMTHRYASVQVVGWSGRATDINQRDREVDEQVFRVHPFLPVWGS